MKRIIAIAMGAALCLNAAAQSWDEALLFSENQYGGTARGVAMGNALTALGGDPASLTFNPAGSAVASYGQVVLTPGLSLSVANAGGGAPRGFGNDDASVFVRPTLPGLGLILTENTGRKSGWKRFSYGFVLNSTHNFTRRYKASGENELTSYAEALATSARGFSKTALESDNWFYTGDDAASRPEWMDKVAYLSGIIGGSASLPDNQYVGISQILVDDGNGGVTSRLPYSVYQRFGEQTTGAKHDFLLNFAANYADRLYLGVNMGITVLNYGMAEYFQEEPSDPDFFPPVQTGVTWQSLQMQRNYRLSGSGVYLKAGVLWRPVAGLRLGAAVQTPTIMGMMARNGFNARLDLVGKSTSAYPSPEDEWEYSLVSPARYNFGVAYSFGHVAVLSADYELTNYAHARYTTASGDYGSLPDYMSDANLDIQDALGCSHQFRAGAEFKPTAALSLRAGFNFTTGAQRNFLDYYVDAYNRVQVDLIPLTSEERLSQAKTAVSLGAGYSFGAFFLDAAVRARFLPKEFIVPYYYYTYDYDYTDKYIDDSKEVPMIEAKATLLDAMLTLGWRF